MEKMSTFNDKIVLITGATRGIGEKCAQLFESEGAQLILTGTNPDDIKIKSVLNSSALGIKTIVLLSDTPLLYGSYSPIIRFRFSIYGERKTKTKK